MAPGSMLLTGLYASNTSIRACFLKSFLSNYCVRWVLRPVLCAVIAPDNKLCATLIN